MTHNAAQIDYWNAIAGPTWAEMQAQLDRQIEPLGARAMEGFDPRPGERGWISAAAVGRPQWRWPSGWGPAVR